MLHVVIATGVSLLTGPISTGVGSICMCIHIHKHTYVDFFIYLCILKTYTSYSKSNPIAQGLFYPFAFSYLLTPFSDRNLIPRP